MKICFIYDGETNKRYLEIISKMTPGRSGKWKDIEGVTEIKDADWCVVIDSTRQNVPLDRTLFLSAHPYIEGYSGYTDNSNKPHKLDLKDTFGFGEWWLKYDYDFLSKLQPLDKFEDACCIMSNTGGEFGKDRRKIFAKNISGFVDVYGRIKGVGNGSLEDPEGYWFGKANVLGNYRYSVEIDIGKTKNYFSERFFDSLLMWCKPLYWGSTNIEDYLPRESFEYIDIYGDGEDVRQEITKPINYNAIAEARDLLLNKYQIWARVHDYIHKI